MKNYLARNFILLDDLDSYKSILKKKIIASGKSFDLKEIDILFNKVNGNSVDQDILKEIFDKFNIIGKISFSTKFTELANNIREVDLGLKKYIKILEKVS